MSILNIREAVRSGSKVIVGIAGVSGSGKTYTAIKVARGMVDHPNEIGFLDTENKRGSLNADILDAPFLIGDLYSPFSPQRYVEAIKEFQDAGVKVLIIDSMSHEWESEGGCEDIANNTNSKMKNWKLAKAEHKKFMTALLQCDMHVIAFFRAREKTDFTNPKQPKSLGIQPIAEKNTVFEMTVSMMMHNEGYNQQFIKMPEALRPLFGDGNGYLGESHGKSLIDWVNSGAKIDPALNSWKNKLQLSANEGMDSLIKCWNKVPKKLKPQLVDHKEICKSSATAFDEMNNQPDNQDADQFSDGGFNPAKPDPEVQATAGVNTETGEISNIEQQQVNSDNKF